MTDDLRAYFQRIYQESKEIERKKNAPPRVFEPPEASDLVARAKEIMAQHRCSIKPIWSECRTWSSLDAAWLSLSVDPGLVDPWRLDSDWRARLTAIAEEMARLLSRLVGETGTPAEFIRALRKIGVHHEWMSDCGDDLLIQDEGAPADTIPTGWRADPKLMKSRKQEFAVLASIKAKRWDPMSVPDGEKGTIRLLCEDEYPELFAATSFDATWNRGRNKLWRMQSHESYSRRGRE